MRELVGSIKSEILKYPDHYEIHPGHGPATTVGTEKTTNPFISAWQSETTMAYARLLRLAAYLAVALVVVFAFVNEISKVYFLKSENRKIEKRIEDLRAENEAYKKEIKAIREDKKYLEKILREELGMIKEREKIFRFKEE